MTWDEMKKIAAARTRGEWYSQYEDIYNRISDEDIHERLITCDGGYESSEGSNQENDAKFIAIAANNWGKIEKVIDIANELIREITWADRETTTNKLINALKELEL